MKVTFTILGPPQGKGRPRFSKIGNYVTTRTPDQTVLYENLIKTEYQRQCGGFRFLDGTALEMNIKAFYAIPASVTKKRKAAMQAGKTRPTKKPDADNVVKVVADSLNEIAYRDDAQIVDCRFAKFFCERPRLEVTIQTAEITERGGTESE